MAAKNEEEFSIGVRYMAPLLDDILDGDNMANVCIRPDDSSMAPIYELRLAPDIAPDDYVMKEDEDTRDTIHDKIEERKNHILTNGLPLIRIGNQGGHYRIFITPYNKSKVKKAERRKNLDTAIEELRGFFLRYQEMTGCEPSSTILPSYDSSLTPDDVYDPEDSEVISEPDTDDGHLSHITREKPVKSYPQRKGLLSRLLRK